MPAAPRTVLYNRAHVVMVALADNEARRDPGYDVATGSRCRVLLSNGQPRRRRGSRLSARGARPPERLGAPARGRSATSKRPTTTLIVNMAHVVEVSEVPEA